MGRFELSARVYKGQPGLLVRECTWTRSDGGQTAPRCGVVGLALGTVGILGCRQQVLYYASCSDIALGGLMSVSAAPHRSNVVRPRCSECVLARLSRTI